MQTGALSPAEIKDLYDRKASVMLRRPGFARGSGHARVNLGAGFACAIEHEDRALLADQPAAEGGGGAGPHPGQLMRASLGACLAMGYRIWGARLDVPITGVEVELTCAYDARGQMGVDPAVAIGWQRVVFDVRVTSSASEADVRRVVEIADRLSPMLANLAPHIERVHTLCVVRAEASPPPSLTAARQA